MTKSQHTPGPWLISSNDSAQYHYIHGADKTVVAELHKSWDKSKTNARLIVAAPKMLAALEYLLEQSQKRFDAPDNELDIAWGEARNVINEAKGGQL